MAAQPPRQPPPPSSQLSVDGVAMTTGPNGEAISDGATLSGVNTSTTAERELLDLRRRLSNKEKELALKNKELRTRLTENRTLREQLDKKTSDLLSAKSALTKSQDEARQQAERAEELVRTRVEKSRYESVVRDCATLRERLKALEKDHREVTLQLGQRDQDLAAAHTTISELQSSVAQQDNQLTSLEEKTSSDNSRLTMETAQLKEDLAAAREQLSEKSIKLEQITKVRDVIEQNLRDTQYETSKLTKEMKELRTQLHIRTETTSVLRTQLEDIQHEGIVLSQAEVARLRNSEAELIKVQQKNGDLQRSIELHMDLLRRAEEKHAAQKKELSAATEENDHLRAEIGEIAQRIRQEESLRLLEITKTAQKLRMENSHIREDLQTSQQRDEGAASRVRTLEQGMESMVRGRQQVEERRSEEIRRRKQMEDVVKALRNRLAFMLEQAEEAGAAALAMEEKRRVLLAQLSASKAANQYLEHRLFVLQQHFYDNVSEQKLRAFVREMTGSGAPISSAATEEVMAALSSPPRGTSRNHSHSSSDSPSRRRGRGTQPSPSRGSGGDTTTVPSHVPAATAGASLPLLLPGDATAVVERTVFNATIAFASKPSEKLQQLQQQMQAQHHKTGSKQDRLALQKLQAVDPTATLVLPRLNEQTGQWEVVANDDDVGGQELLLRLHVNTFLRFFHVLMAPKPGRQDSQRQISSPGGGAGGYDEYYGSAGGGMASPGSHLPLHYPPTAVSYGQQQLDEEHAAWAENVEKARSAVAEKLAEMLNQSRAIEACAMKEYGDVRTKHSRAVARITVLEEFLQDSQQKMERERIAKHKSVLKYVNEVLAAYEQAVRLERRQSHHNRGPEGSANSSNREQHFDETVLPSSTFLTQPMSGPESTMPAGASTPAGGRGGAVFGEGGGMGGGKGKPTLDIRLPDSSIDDETGHSIVAVLTGQVEEAQSSHHPSTTSATAPPEGANGLTHHVASLPAPSIAGPSISWARHLSVLDLRRNALTDLAARLICPLVEDGRRLRFVDLRDNHLSSRGCLMLFEAVRRNESVLYCVRRENGMLLQGSREVPDADADGAGDIHNPRNADDRRESNPEAVGEEPEFEEVCTHPLVVDMRHNDPSVRKIGEVAADSLAVKRSSGGPAPKGAVSGASGARHSNGSGTKKREKSRARRSAQPKPRPAASTFGGPMRGRSSTRRGGADSDSESGAKAMRSQPPPPAGGEVGSLLDAHIRQQELSGSHHHGHPQYTPASQQQQPVVQQRWRDGVSGNPRMTRRRPRSASPATGRDRTRDVSPYTQSGVRERPRDGGAGHAQTYHPGHASDSESGVPRRARPRSASSMGRSASATSNAMYAQSWNPVRAVPNEYEDGQPHDGAGEFARSGSGAGQPKRKRFGRGARRSKKAAGRNNRASSARGTAPRRGQQPPVGAPPDKYDQEYADHGPDGGENVLHSSRGVRPRSADGMRGTLDHAERVYGGGRQTYAGSGRAAAMGVQSRGSAGAGGSGGEGGARAAAATHGTNGNGEPALRVRPRSAGPAVSRRSSLLRDTQNSQNYAMSRDEQNRSAAALSASNAANAAAHLMQLGLSTSRMQTANLLHGGNAGAGPSDQKRRLSNQSSQHQLQQSQRGSNALLASLRL